ncbi:MAG: hypothetical protein K0S33_1959 [Bacteroidetes bacterium]|jgi:hypothetical protein|nr:hypothetical protein [Bacteroidota bacterium]
MKYIYTFVLAICLAFISNAQAPQGINYQGVARNTSGIEITNQPIGIELSIVDGSPTGTVVYTETHTVTTDMLGLFSLMIGGGTPTTGTFSAVNWATGGGKWLKVSMDISGGTSYLLMGTSQLLSVPYALFAGNVTNNGGKQTLVLSDDVTDVQAAAIIASEVGPNTQEIKIVGTTNLTTVDLSMITTAIYIEVDGNTSLASLNLGALTRCDGPIMFRNCPALSNLNISALAKITTGELALINTGLTSVSLPALVKCNGDLHLNENTSLISATFPGLTRIENLYIEDNTAASSISFPALTTIADEFSVTGNSVLGTLSFPALTSSQNITLNSNNVTTYSFPALTQSGSLAINTNPALTTANFSALTNAAGHIGFMGNNSLTSVNFAGLSTCNSFGFSSNPLLNSVTVSSLVTSGSISFNQNPALTSLAFPLLTSTGSNNVYITSCGVTSVSIPALTTFGSSFNLSSNHLTVASVNALLAKLVSITPPLSGKMISLNLQTPVAAPSGQGVTDKNTLMSNGNTVSTD